MSIERRMAEIDARNQGLALAYNPGGPLPRMGYTGGHPIGGETGRQPCDCRRKRHTLLPQAGNEPVRWARCGEPDGMGGWQGGCGALSRWSPSPVPTWIERHAIEVAVVGLAVVIAAWCLIGEVFP